MTWITQCFIHSPTLPGWTPKPGGSSTRTLGWEVAAALGAPSQQQGLKAPLRAPKLSSLTSRRRAAWLLEGMEGEEVTLHQAASQALMTQVQPQEALPPSLTQGLLVCCRPSLSVVHPIPLNNPHFISTIYIVRTLPSVSNTYNCFWCQ